MKKLILMLLVITLAASCKKEPVNPNTPKPPKMTVDPVDLRHHG